MVKSIVVYEPDLQNMRIRANNLVNLFTMIWSYSNKMFNHMQIFSHLINDLIDSEDLVEVKQTKMLQHGFNNENISQNNQLNNSDKIKEIVSKMTNENKQLSQRIDVELNQTEQLKDFFNKALSQINEKFDQNQNDSLRNVNQKNGIWDTTNYSSYNDQQRKQNSFIHTHNDFLFNTQNENQESSNQMQKQIWVLIAEKEQLQQQNKELRENKDKMETHYKFIENQKTEKITHLKQKIEQLKNKTIKESKNQDSKGVSKQKKQLEEKNEIIKNLQSQISELEKQTNEKSTKNNQKIQDNKNEFYKNKIEVLEQKNLKQQQENEELNNKINQLHLIIENLQQPQVNTQKESKIEIENDLIKCLFVQSKKLDEYANEFQLKNPEHFSTNIYEQE